LLILLLLGDEVGIEDKDDADDTIIGFGVGFWVGFWVGFSVGFSVGIGVGFSVGIGDGLRVGMGTTIATVFVPVLDIALAIGLGDGLGDGLGVGTGTTTTAVVVLDLADFVLAGVAFVSFAARLFACSVLLPFSLRCFWKSSKFVFFKCLFTCGLSKVLPSGFSAFAAVVRPLLPRGFNTFSGRVCPLDGTNICSLLNTRNIIAQCSNEKKIRFIIFLRSEVTKLAMKMLGV